MSTAKSSTRAGSGLQPQRSTHVTTPATEAELSVAPGADPARQAFLILRAAFVLAPVVVGLDKFTNWLVQWDTYLAPALSDPLPVSPHQAMYAVGVIEVVAGVLVALHPRLGALVVAGWLAGIITDLLLLRGYYDVAIRDFGLLLAALALQRLATRYDLRPIAWPLRRG